jgi:hypothetical protein
MTCWFCRSENFLGFEFGEEMAEEPHLKNATEERNQGQD